VENESGSKIVLENPQKTRHKNIMKTQDVVADSVCPQLETGYWRAITDTLLSLDIL